MAVSTKVNPYVAPYGLGISAEPKEKRFDPFTAPYRDCPICKERVFFTEPGDYYHIGKTNEQTKTTHYQFFHKECFMEMVGEKFMNRITMEVPWCNDKNDNWRGRPE